MFIELKIKTKHSDNFGYSEFIFNSEAVVALITSKERCSIHIEFSNGNAVFEFDNLEDTENVYEAFRCALTGMKTKELREGLGFVRPVMRPFMNESALIPSAYQGDELK